MPFYHNHTFSAPVWTVTGRYTAVPSVPPPIAQVEAEPTLHDYIIPKEEEVKMPKVYAKDVTVCSSCGSNNLTETPDPLVAKECLDCGSLMLTDGDVLQMAV